MGSRTSGALRIEIAGGDTARDLNLSKRVRRVQALVGPLAGKRLLDCGCGAGGYAAAYAALGARVVAVEYQLEKLRRAPRGLAGVQYIAGDACALPLSDTCIEVVVLNEVLEHIPDQERALREARRVLVSGGKLVLMSPNRLYPFESHGVRWRRGDRPLPAHTPFVPYVPLALGTRVFDYWARNYWPWELRALVERAGFRILQRGFIAQTFEGLSGTQPRWVRVAKPALRAGIGWAERIPGLRALCSVSQLVVAEA
jgi:SAM-dependent methyltransferase